VVREKCRSRRGTRPATTVDMGARSDNDRWLKVRPNACDFTDCLRRCRSELPGIGCRSGRISGAAVLELCQEFADLTPRSSSAPMGEHGGGDRPERQSTSRHFSGRSFLGAGFLGLVLRVVPSQLCSAPHVATPVACDACARFVRGVYERFRNPHAGAGIKKT
jgi:hypothetical protein